MGTVFEAKLIDSESESGKLAPSLLLSTDSLAPKTVKWRLSVQDHRAQSLGELRVQNVACTVAELPIGNFLVRSLRLPE
jgi:hypothetical protein